MKRDVYLYGALAERFGHHHRYNVDSPAQAGRALCATLKGFRQAVVGVELRVVRGDPDTGLEIGPDDLKFKLGAAPLHIMPAIEGAKKGGLAKIVLGAAFIGIGVATGGVAIPALGAVSKAEMALFGLSLAATGIAQALAPTPKADYGQRETPDQRPSFIFNNAVNMSEQGGCVPALYGRARAGSVLVSAGLTVEQL